MRIYGFGSYFSGSKSYTDIDILIVHDLNDYQSCMQAIKCKRAILKKINKSNVSILSKSEELDFDFISRSGAIPLGDVDEGSIENIVYMVKTFKNRIF
ncbi:hypothetical protein [Legionella maceachernii]|uniref:Nucleotidyltransferase domain protein n=1 Tax=Legionella maceachernii TaxID=466 RepID=A0A0W0W6I1_9GAMM|nr:hypothetical protein [Legionella maceachernii]KTD27979.1 hypothetical protein Lmac_1038 [Legionella maceachernii]SKA06146.1 hypothetical protein SAMN02745128_01925 [Legionella maceachernii]SUO99917.1 Uncharacterised protein [Legionella maceachernii]